MLLAFVGCGGNSVDIPDTVDVSGVVTLDGKAVEGVDVHFATDKFDGYGKTDSQGRYQLIQGAVPGQNKIYFSKIEGGETALGEGIDETQLRMAAEAMGDQGGAKVAREIIPEEFTDPATTKLTFPVPEGGTDKADFKLQTK